MACGSDRAAIGNRSSVIASIDFNELSVVLTNRLRFSLAQYW